MTHNLKIRSEYFIDILKGIKTFEVRKNDRNFQLGDYINFNCDKPIGEKYHGLSKVYEIVYILNDLDYCKDGFVILGIKPFKIST